jgi:hypothetical protein
MSASDPWEQSLRILERPAASFVIADAAIGRSWRPYACRDPRRRSDRVFATTPEAVAFVIGRLRAMVAHRREPRVRARVERLRGWERSEACVLVVGGSVGRPPIYVKWMIDRSVGPEGRIIFLSFHESERSWR